MDKKTYICPNVEIHRVMVESQLLADSEDGKATSGLSKGHDSFFDSWDSNDEEQPSGFTSKNLWDD